VIGYMNAGTDEAIRSLTAAFRRGLGELATSKEITSNRYIGGRARSMIACQHWHWIWYSIAST
jgi:hypothetical protein